MLMSCSVATPSQPTLPFLSRDLGMWRSSWTPVRIRSPFTGTGTDMLIPNRIPYPSDCIKRLCSRHCSRQAPEVFAFRTEDAPLHCHSTITTATGDNTHDVDTELDETKVNNGGKCGGTWSLRITSIKQRESEDSLLQFLG